MPLPTDTLCPSCRAPMAQVRLANHHGGPLLLDLCHACHGIWFDEGENRQLAPQSVVELFKLLHEHRDELPPRLQAVVPRMAAHDWLGSYRERGNVDAAVRGIATRLSRNGDKLVACLDVLRANEARVDAAFDAFFPDLIEAAQRLRSELA